MINYIITHSNTFLKALIEHIVVLSLIPVLISSILGIILGIICSRSKIASNIILNVVNVFQTIPSLALLSLLVAMGFGIGYVPAIVAMILYSLLTITRCTLTGITNIDDDIILSSKSLGMTNMQLLIKVQLPLALASIMSGIRITTVATLGMGTIAAMVGAGGLGQFILTGLSQLKFNLVLVGAIPSAILALIADYGLGMLEKKLIIE